MGIRHSSLTALAVGALALGTGCLSTDAKKTEVKKPDVMQPGVLPPPQDTTATGVIPAGGAMPAAHGAAPSAQAAPVGATAAPAAGGVGALTSKLAGKLERPKMVATDFAVGWQTRVAYLPDPTRSGRMSPGIAGQMFLFGGPKLEFAQADGVLTVDLVDDSPRPPGQPAATPERWQFPKEVLRNLQTRDETFGKSYVLFLPWPAYRPDITRVKISARYDPENGPPLFATPSTVTLDSTPFGTPVFTDVSKDKGGASAPGRPGGPQPGALVSSPGPAIPLGGPGFGAPPGTAPMMPIPNASAPAPMMPIPGNAAPMMPIPSGAAPLMPIPNGPLPIPGRGGDAGNFAPATAVPGDVPQIGITLPVPPRQ